MPAISPESLYGAVHLAGDGHLDPHGATHAVADAARALGVRIRTGVRVTGFELSARREITAVLTDAGPIATELVVNAAGIWAPQVAAMVGAFIPSTPVDHQHIALKAVPGSELPREMPCFRDPDNLVYGKSEHGGMVFGGYELDPRSRWEDGVPWEHAAAVAAGRLRAVRAADGRRDPALPVPGRRRGDPAGLPPGRDDARREPVAGATPRGSRVLGRGRAVAQRVRRWGRDRPGDGRLDHGRRPGRRHRAVPGVAVQRHVPRSRVRGRAGARDVLGLLPAALSVRRGPGRPAAAAVRAPRPAPGGGRGVRHEGRLGAGRLPRAGSAVAPCRARPGRLRLDAAALVRAGRARRRGPSASGPASSICRRSARSPSRGRARSGSSSASAPTTSTDPSGASSTRSGATSAAGWSPTSPSRASPTTGSGS